jgi:hypothetical protein
LPIIGACVSALSRACSTLVSDAEELLELLEPSSVETRVLKLLCSALSACDALELLELSLLELPLEVLEAESAWIRFCKALAIGLALPDAEEELTVLVPLLEAFEELVALAACACSAAKSACRKLCSAAAAAADCDELEELLFVPDESDVDELLLTAVVLPLALVSNSAEVLMPSLWSAAMTD